VKRIGLVLLVALAAGPLAACESTQDKSRRLAAHGKGLLAEQGVEVAKRTKAVKVVSSSVITDANGTAVAVKLRNLTNRTLWRLPISIDVRGAGGKSVFRNDQPGLEPTLAHVPLLRPGETFTWVNDQVAASGRAMKVRARVGAGEPIKASRLPRVTLTGARLQDDLVSGVAAVGLAANRSKVELHKVVVFATATRNGRVVAAGRGQIVRLKPGKRVHFQAFFIGDPRGARLELSAPPSGLR
jgi:hypothetical protein